MLEKLSQRVAVVAKIDPQLVDAAAKTSDYVDMTKFEKAIFILLVGATDITVDMKLRSFTNGSGGGGADITGKAITQYTADDDNKVAIIEITAEELAQVSGATHVAAVATVGDGSTGAQIALVALGGEAKYLPAVNYNLAAVKEIVN